MFLPFFILSFVILLLCGTRFGIKMMLIKTLQFGLLTASSLSQFYEAAREFRIPTHK